MEDRTATVVIEARSLVREAFVSLMESHSYHVICSVGSIADIDRGVFKEARPKLVLLGALPTDRVADATSSIRRYWQDAKIIMLLENASSKDLQKLLASGLDACIPMFASPRTLIDILQLIVCERLRVLIVSDSTIPEALIDLEEGEDDEARQEEPPLVKSLTSPFLVPVMASAHGLLAKEAGGSAARAAGGPGFSAREEKILKALTRGHSNKVIARMNSVTEATVKVKMRSILRKIQVANRTQAAIWAIKNTDFADEVS
jgi:two-component system nitrate/nitrite response regulator NarL